MYTIMFANQKGGVGKTTSVQETAYFLSKKYSVLLIDFDGQRNLTMNFELEENDNKCKTIYDLLTENSSLENSICEIRKNIDIIPGHRKMLSQYFISPEDIYLLKRLIKEIESYNVYDFILIDVGPESGQLMTMAMIASDYIVAITDAGINSYHGLIQMCKDLSNCKEIIKDFNVNVIGMLFTQADIRTNIANNSINRLNSLTEIIGAPLFKTYIRKSVCVDEAKEFQQFISEYQPNSTVADDYKNFCLELMERLKK